MQSIPFNTSERPPGGAVLDLQGAGVPCQFPRRVGNYGLGFLSTHQDARI